jgi:proprotein convertase subtilisin/kexin type 5
VAGTQYYLSVKACISVCPSGQFGDSGGTIPTCSSCTGDCATCRGSSTTCLSCSTGALGYGENVCYTNCPEGSYNPGTNFCKLCPGQCLTCSNLTACSSCGIEGGLQTYLHTDFNCYSTCPNDYYGGKDVSNNFVCLACDGSCNGCQSSSTNCLQCENSTFFRKIGSSLCTSACGTGLYGNPNTGLCTYCPVGCSACSYTT